MRKQARQLETHFRLADNFSFGERGRLERCHKAMKVIDKSNACDVIWSKKCINNQILKKMLTTNVLFGWKTQKGRYKK